MATPDQYYNQIGANLAPQAQDVASANNQYASDVAGGAGLTQKLKDALNNKLNNNQDLIDQKNQSMAAYFQAPSAARVKYADVWDPAQREKLVAGDTANALAQYTTFGDLLNTRQGTIKDLIDSAVQGWGAVTNADKLRSDTAQNSYNAGLDQYKTAIEAYNATKPTGSGNSAIDSLISSWIKQMLPGSSATNTTIPTESKPTIIPNNPNIKFHSPQGQWIYVPEAGDWLPVTI